MWSFQTGGQAWGSPAVADGKVFIGCGSTNSKIYCLDSTDGSLIWSYRTIVRSLSGPIVCDGVVYAGCGDVNGGRIYAFESNNLSPTNLTLNLNSETTFTGFKVTLNGTLTTINGSAVPGVPIELSYSINNGQTWNDITSVTTAGDGSYNAVWVPSVTGTYLVKAKLSESYPYAQSEAYRALSVTLYNSQYVFGVESNSTVSELEYNSTSNQLSFTASGESGTTGFVNVSIAKSLVANIEDVVVNIDNTSVEYEAVSTADSWIISLTYPHSTHYINIILESLPSPTPTPATTPTPTPTATPTPTSNPIIPEDTGWLVILLPIVMIVMLTLKKSVRTAPASDLTNIKK